MPLPRLIRWAFSRRLRSALIGAFGVGVLALLATVLPAHAQPAPATLDPSRSMSQYAHRVWQAEDGLPQSSVGAITQTRDGYLWLGTQQGLARFDGVTFEVFDRANTPALKNDWIKALLEGRDGALWIGTGGGGLVRFHEGTWTRYTTREGLGGDVVRALHEDRDGRLWIATIGGGLSVFDGAAFTTYTTQIGLPSNRVTDVESDASGALWVATAGGLARLQNGTVTARYASEDGLGTDVVWALEASAEGGLWVGTDRGLVRLRGGAFTAYPPEGERCGGAMNALHEDGSGTLWIGTTEDGLCRFRDGAFAAFTEEDGLTHALIRALYADREGSLWIGTESGGLNRLRASPFAAYTTRQGLSSDVVYSVLEDHEGTIWVGTEGGGLARLRGGDVTAFTTSDGLSSDIVLALHEDRRRRLWIGTFDGGLCRRDEDGFTCFSAEDGLGSDFVSAVLEDHRGDLWAATEGGLSRLRDGAFTTFTTSDGLPSNGIVTLLEDRRGALWIGTWGGGISRMDAEGRFTTYAEAQGLSDLNVTSLYEDRKGRLWAGTHGGGLCRLEEDRFVCLTKQDGLYHDDVLQILEDDEGHLWLGSSRGLSRLRLADLNARLRLAGLPAHARGQLGLLAPTRYGKDDGLKSTEMNGGTQPAALRSRDGRLWFATMHGVAVTSPPDLQPNPVLPPVKLTGFSVDGEAYPLAGTLRIPPGGKRFDFRFTALSLVAPERVRFRYKLEGYDEGWTEVENERGEHYTNLPPGRYRFRVAASNNDGVWAEEEAALAFYVAPFFYQTYGFYALALLLLVLAVAGAVRLRVRRLEARERHLTRLVGEQTRELRQRKRELERLNGNLHREVQRQLDRLIEERSRYERELVLAKERAEASAQLKSTILDNISHEIRTPITAILGYSQILSEEVGGGLQEFADYILRNGERLQKTLNAILDLSQLEADEMPLLLEPTDLGQAATEALSRFRPEAEAKGLALRYSGPASAVAARLDPLALGRVLDHLVGNAVKFTERGEVVVEAGGASSGAYLEVRDTGIGIGEAFLPHLFEAFKQESDGLSRTHEGSGLGLTVARHLVERMGGTIHVESRKGEGTTFVVRFPSAAREGQGRARPATSGSADRPCRSPRPGTEERSAGPGVPPPNAGSGRPAPHAHAPTRHRMPPRARRLPRRLGAPEAAPGPDHRGEAA